MFKHAAQISHVDPSTARFAFEEMLGFVSGRSANSFTDKFAAWRFGYSAKAELDGSLCAGSANVVPRSVSPRDDSSN